MKLFYVTYDLVKTKDYKTLYEALQQLGAKRVLESVWCFRRANITAAAICNHLTKFIDHDDRLLVIEASDWAGRRLMTDPNKV